MNTLLSPGLTSDTNPASGGTVQRVYDSLRQRIITLELQPETTLSRTELTDTYDVSQTPIREALQRLQQDGLVRIYPQSRTVVTRIDIPQIYEAHFLRIALESEVASALARQGAEETTMRAASIIRMQEAVADDPGQLRMFQELDELFHQTLFIGLGRIGLHQLIRARSGHLERVRRLTLPEQGKIRDILDGHHRIVQAIRDRDPQAAEEATRDHLSHTVSKVEELRNAYPQFFA